MLEWYEMLKCTKENLKYLTKEQLEDLVLELQYHIKGYMTPYNND